MKLNYPELKYWTVVDNDRINGLIFGDKRLSDGTEVTTSRIIRYILEQNVILVQTKYSMYIIKSKKAYGGDDEWERLAEMVEKGVNHV